MSLSDELTLTNAYKALIDKYNQTKDKAVDDDRRRLLSFLYNLELRIYGNSYTGSGDDTQKIQKSNERREVIRPLLEKINTLKDTILRLDDILTSDDTPIHKHVYDRLHYNVAYYLYKKKDGLYYLYEKKKDEKPTNITMLFEYSKEGSLDIEHTLENLQEFIIMKIKELESEITELMKMEHNTVLIKSKKYVDFYETQPSYMLIYRKTLKEIVNDKGTKNIYYLLYYNKDTSKLSYKIHGYDNKKDIEPNPLDTLDDLSDTLTILYEFHKLLKIPQGVNQQPVKPPNIFGKLRQMFSSKVVPSPSSGGKKVSTAYKSTGDKVRLFIDNKKLHRSIYVKGNGKAKYCKINNEFVLLSKLKNKVIE